MISPGNTSAELPMVKWKAAPFSEAAKTLIENGLVLSNPREKNASGAFNDQISMIAIMRGDGLPPGKDKRIRWWSFPKLGLWKDQDLTNIQVGYDPSEGNTL